MRLWLKILIGVAFALLVLIGLGWFWLTGPEREVDRNPIMKIVSQQTTKWDTRVSLAPNLWMKGASRETVEQALFSAGFSELDGAVHPTWIPRDDSDPYKNDLKNEGEIVFARNHGNFACDLDYIVFLKFDSSNSLISAEGLIRALGCL